MKATIGILILAFCIPFLNVQAQRRVVTTTRAMSYDISDNLDLDAVASIFGDSKDLEDFEYRLNDPDNRISNLDLNQDGYIDYLRVVENSSDRNSLVVIQAVLDQDVYQDVATIEIERVQSGGLRVQIVGDAYIYGSNYIIEPVFVRDPVIFSFFWSSHYRPYYSPYYWNYYPRWYSYYSPYPTYKYHRHVHHYINNYNTYHHTTERFIHFSDDRYSHVRRNDYASRYPDRAFTKRHEGVTNKYELERRRPTQGSSGRNNRASNVESSNKGRQYQNKNATTGGRNDRSGNTYERRRPSSNVQSGGNNQNRTRVNGNEQSNANRTNASDAPVRINSGSGQNPTRENRNIESRRNSSGSHSAPVQVKSANRNESGNEGSVSRSRSNQPSNRSGNQVDSRNSTPREKSGSVISRSSRTNNEVKQQNTRKQESPKSDDKKEKGNGRRR